MRAAGVTAGRVSSSGKAARREIGLLEAVHHGPALDREAAAHRVDARAGHGSRAQPGMRRASVHSRSGLSTTSTLTVPSHVILRWDLPRRSDLARGAGLPAPRPVSAVLRPALSGQDGLDLTLS